MSNSREEILSYLAQAGITGKTVEDVVAEFNSSDLLSSFIVGADDVEEAILSHITDYLAIHGITGLSAPAAAQDPTNTVKAGAGATMPAAVTDAQKNAIIATTQATYADRQLMGQKASIVAVLGDKPYPGDYMGNVGKLPVKGDIAKVKEVLESQYQPAGDLDQLLAKTDTWFIPSNAQLESLKVLYPTRPGAKAIDPAKKSSKPKTDPAWVGFDNDTAYNNILRQLSSGDGTFDVMIAPKEDTGTGAEKEKGWRWGTKGFCVKYPDAGAGTDSMKEHDMTKKQLIGFLVAQTLGAIDAVVQDGLSAKLFMTNPRNTESSGTAATERKPSIRVRGNSIANHPDVRFIKAAGNGQTKMTCRSKAFYFAVRIDKNGKWSVRKQRIALQWEQAPTFETLPQYKALFPVNADGSSKKLTAADLKSMQEAQAAVVMNIMAEPTSAGEYGLQDLLGQVEDRINKTAALAAKSIAL